MYQEFCLQRQSIPAGILFIGGSRGRAWHMPPYGTQPVKTYAKKKESLNPIKVTAQAGDRENWATAGTRHLANHPPEEKEK